MLNKGVCGSNIGKNRIKRPTDHASFFSESNSDRRNEFDHF
ncbi:hypothetical protein OH687_23595 [Burkholderia anthina]|nr:hypothetical protein OH687_23595 [Burkholderia anthina]